MIRDLVRTKWLIGLLVLASMVYACAGCSTMSVGKQVREMPNSLTTLNTVRDTVIAKQNSGEWTQEQVDRVMVWVNNVGKAYNVYVRVLYSYLTGSMVQGTGTQLDGTIATIEGLTTVLIAVNDNMFALTEILKEFGVEIK